MRLCFIGCVAFSHSALGHILNRVDVEVAGVITREQSRLGSDFRSLSDLAQTANCPAYLAQGNDQRAMAEWLAAIAPDVVYAFGWQYLLKPEVLSIPPLGVVGYHPAALPQNRGRHPIIWALALGLPATASTFFFMDAGADSGDIISQEPVPVQAADDAATLYAKLTDTAMGQIEQFTPRIADGTVRRRPQDDALANSWRKRGVGDGQIDWRMSAGSVHNLVRALHHPYPGAHCVVAGSAVKVWKTAVESAPPNLEPGKVLESGVAGIVVKCGEGAVRLTTHEFAALPEVGSYL